MMINENRKYWFGEFQVGQQPIFGELKIDENDTNLYLQSDQYISLDVQKDRQIFGELRDKRKVSLLECNIPPIPGNSMSKKGSYSFSNIFPHIVIVGDDHVPADEKIISDIHWCLKDIGSIFYDFDAFGTSLNPERFIADIVKDNERMIDRKIPIGSQPQIQFFSGRIDIFSCDIGIGKFLVRHRYGDQSFGISGVSMLNKIQTSIEFKCPMTIHDALNVTYDISVFLGIAIGRPQNVDQICIGLSNQSEEIPKLQVFPSLQVKNEDPDQSHPSPGPSDVLLDGLGRPDEFSSVVRHWLKTHTDMETPRARFWDSFTKQDRYGVERMIAAANLFDTIPSSVLQTKVDLSDDFLCAIDKAKTIFKPLPNSTQRESILGGLKRLSQPNLKSKIKYWASPINEAAEGRFENLDFVIDRAVNCRNFFVHGGKAEFDYYEELNTLAFLTRALEFCYLIPEFIKAGWSWKEWGKGYYHPFGEFDFNYAANLGELQSLFNANKAAKSSNSE